MLKKNWDPAIYTQCSDFQYNAAKNFLDTCSFKNDASILDIGCGNGKTTDYIASKLTSGHVTGIDKSASMIEFAKEQLNIGNYHKNLDFQVIDVEQLTHTAKFDAAVSFFCIPWVINKALAFQNIAKSLKDEAPLYILAAIYEKSQAELITRLTEKPHWQEYFENYQSPFSYLNDTNYADYARAAEIHVNSVEKLNLEHKFKNKAELHNFYLTLVPQISHLREEKKKNAFADELLEDYFKVKGNEECTVTIEAIKLSGRKLTCSANLTPSNASLAFFRTPETDEENENDLVSRFHRLNGA